mgnify:CR=1 FL=1
MVKLITTDLKELNLSEIIPYRSVEIMNNIIQGINEMTGPQIIHSLVEDLTAINRLTARLIKINEPQNNVDEYFRNRFLENRKFKHYLKKQKIMIIKNHSKKSW